MQSELSKLIADVKENLLFLQELGVSDLRTDIDALQTSKPVTKTAAAAEKEPARVAPPANLETKREAPANAPARSLKDKLEATKLSRFSGSENESAGLFTLAENTQENTQMKKESAAAESLFGDISPTNELAPSEETLEGIHNSIAGCKLCRLWEGRTQIVNSTGNPKARLMFIGEGKPFVGRAGQLLTKIIEAIGMNRDEVFIGNINRCRPPGNRAPMADEATMCKPFLLREIAVVRPKVIVVLGATAMQNLLETKAPIGKLRGNFQDYFGIKVMPTFHPAYLLRDPHKKREVWEDMKKVKAALEKE